MKVLDHSWRWDHLYHIRSESGVAKIRIRPEQKVRHDLFYPAFFAQQRLDVIILKDRQRGTSTDCNLICMDLSSSTVSAERWGESRDTMMTA